MSLREAFRFYDCAAGGSVMADCGVMEVGDLVRIIGHGKMDFIPETAARMALDILERCRRLGWHDPEMDDGK